MTRKRTVSRCAECGHEELRWVGRCPACAAWGSMGEERPVSAEPGAGSDPRPAVPIKSVALDAMRRTTTGCGELDRVLGGGLVPGSVVLVAGEPGIGKSTLLLQTAAFVASSGGSVLYVAGEESPGQIRLRAERVGALAESLLIASETSVEGIRRLVAVEEPALLVVDSIQTITDRHVSSPPGSVAQVRESAAALASCAKAAGFALVLVGHLTKDGTVAGPRTLEHLVDTVLLFDGEREQPLRLLRAVKNRFGPAGEVGCFEITEDGLAGVADASRVLSNGGAHGTPGVVAAVTLEGPRPLAVEIQALVARSELASPRRRASGLDQTRFSVLVAVLQRRVGLDLLRDDLFTSVAGGIRLREPGVDLAVALAVASAKLNTPVRSRLVACGEVGLAGEVRMIPRTAARLAEAARLGFESAVVPAAYDGPAHGLQLRPVADVANALRTALQRRIALVGTG